MNILLDSHLLIWSLNDDPRLSDFARDYIIDPINTIYYSLLQFMRLKINISVIRTGLRYQEKN